MNTNNLNDEEEAIAEHAMSVIQTHVIPEKPLETNALWVSAMLNLCIAWLFHVVGEKRALGIVQASINANRMHLDDPKPFKQ